MELKPILADAITNLEQTGVNFLSSIRLIVWVIVALAIVVNGLLCMWEKTRDKAKASLPWVAIGAVLMLGATEIAQYVIGQIAF